MRRFASLRRQGDFARLRARGRRTATPHLTIFTAGPYPADTRPLAGISVSKDVGGAVVRNLVKRRISAALHQALPQHRRLRLLVVARPAAAAAPYAELRAQLEKALE
jgi:ribonuclease P protein component